MYNPAVSTDSVMEHIALRVYHHTYYQTLTRLFEGDLCFIYWAFSALDRYSGERTGKRGRHAAKTHGSDSNPGWLFSAVWHVVTCSTHWAKPVPCLLCSMYNYSDWFLSWSLAFTLEPEVTMFGWKCRMICFQLMLASMVNNKLGFVSLTYKKKSSLFSSQIWNIDLCDSLLDKLTS